MINNYVNHFADHFHQPCATKLFCKSVLIYSILKMMFLWQGTRLAVDYHAVPTIHHKIWKVVLYPSSFAATNFNTVYLSFLVALIAITWFSWNYFSAIVFILITVNLLRLQHPFLNGADIVLMMNAIWIAPMARFPRMHNINNLSLQRLLHNAAIVFCQIQIAFMYFISGWDKLVTQRWRSGEAFHFIRHLKNMFHPSFEPLMQNDNINLTLAWATIIFELGFCVLVWFKKTRLLTLMLGIAFHLIIAVMLSLPDFAFIMILSYLIFLKDEDLEKLKHRFY